MSTSSPNSPSTVPVAATNGSSQTEPNAPSRNGFVGGLIRLLLAIIAVPFLGSSVVLVDETELIIVERLGVITAVYDQVEPQNSDRGLHFKLPWPISTVRRFDRRELLFDPPAREMFTRDRKNITVSAFLTWRIAAATADTPLDDKPVVRFYRRLGTRANAEARLDARLRAALSAEIGQVNLNSLLNVATSDQGPKGGSPLTRVSQATLGALTTAEGKENTEAGLGIALIDLRIRRINLPEGNRIAVYERMRTERMRIAERYRSAGTAERLRIESQAKRHSDELLARAEADAERIRGEGEAEAVTILNAAHAEDPGLYEFQRTLAAYRQILAKQTTVVMSAGSKLFRVLREGVPEAVPTDMPLPGDSQSSSRTELSTDPSTNRVLPPATPTKDQSAAPQTPALPEPNNALTNPPQQLPEPQ